MQAATHSVEFYLSPRFFLKEMAIFTPPLAKFSPAARIIDPPLLGGAARPESATLTVTIIHAWSSMVVDVPGSVVDAAGVGVGLRVLCACPVSGRSWGCSCGW